jgi:hypothetical protein
MVVSFPLKGNMQKWINTYAKNVVRAPATAERYLRGAVPPQLQKSVRATGRILQKQMEENA